jgi:hypothetical protein
MKTTSAILLGAVLLFTGCAKEEAPSWAEVQYRICLRSEPYEKGDTTLSGEFDDLLVVSLPVEIKRGPGEAHAVQDGVWIHFAWDDLQVGNKPRPYLAFDGFRSFVENQFRSPYGVSWHENGWQERGRAGITDEWDRLETFVPIDPSRTDPRVLCKMWRWARSPEKPDIVLGERRECDSTAASRADP